MKAMTWSKGMWAVLLSVSVLVTGCDKGGDELPSSSGSNDGSSAAEESAGRYEELVERVMQVPPEPASSPSEALMGYTRAVIGGDVREAAAHVVSDADSRRWLASIIWQQQVTMRFHALFVDAYGQDALEEFNDIGSPTRPTDAHLTLMTDVSLREFQSNPPKADASTRSVEFGSWEGLDGAVVRVDGGWLVDGAAAIPPSMSVDHFIQILNNRTSATSRYLKAIGYKGITAEDLDIELGRAIMAEGRGTDPGGPHRFRIEEIPDDWRQ